MHEMRRRLSHFRVLLEAFIYHYVESRVAGHVMTKAREPRKLYTVSAENRASPANHTRISMKARSVITQARCAEAYIAMK